MASFQELSKGKYKLYVESGYDANGKRLRKTKTVQASGPREAKKLLAAFETEVYDVNYVDPKDISFTGFVDMWENNYAKKNLAASTLETYKILLDSSLLPYFNKTKLKNLKTLQLVKYFNDETKSLGKKYNILMSIFKKAEEWEIIAHNPMDKVERPKEKKPKKEFYDKEELQLLFKKIEGLLLYQQVLIKLAAVGGLRRGEILALTNNEINGNEVRIWRSLQFTKENGLVLKETKTDEERTITLPDELIKDLKTLHVQQLERKLTTGNLWKGFNDEIMLFANEFGVPFRPGSITTFWRRFVERENLKKISFHDLRHSSASLLISEGINMKIVQERLGHKEISTTLNIYSHVTKKDDEKASNVFKDLL